MKLVTIPAVMDVKLVMTTAVMAGDAKSSERSMPAVVTAISCYSVLLLALLFSLACTWSSPAAAVSASPSPMDIQTPARNL